MVVLNLTQHPATPEQLADGVVDLQGDDLATLKERMTFLELPSSEDVYERAQEIARLASRLLRGQPNQAAMVGGAPFLMAPLEAALRVQGVRPLYAFSVRESVETRLPDGSVRKTAVFRHVGFVPAEADF